jgi:hypothetical protein
MLRPTVSWPVCLGVKLHLGPTIIFLLLSHSYGFVAMGRPLWREDGSVVYEFCWTSPAQSFSGPSPAGHMTIFYCLRFETPQPRGPGPHIYVPQEQGGSIIPPGDVKIKIEVKVTLWLAVYRQSVRLGVKSLEIHEQNFFFNWTFAVIVLM